MDPPSLERPTLPVEEEVENEWDNDGFVIPSLGIDEVDRSGDLDAPMTESMKPPSPDKAKVVEEKIYLGPHGAPREPASSSTRKQRFKQKLKEADQRTSAGVGRENKLENLRELVGGKSGGGTAKGSARDWLDPHCHESQFDKWHTNQ